MDKKLTYLDGLKQGLPICFAYIAVSFTFGLVATRNGIPVWLATLISATNLTSAGQFAGVELIIAAAGYFEIALAVFVINIRYSLMSLSLSQQLSDDVGIFKRLIMSLFITDEIFAIASTTKNRLNFPYFLGLATTPYFGWAFGTLLGGLINNVLPERLQSAMGIALYCMFIAIIIPPAKKSKPILLCISLGAIFSCLIAFGIPNLSMGFSVIIASCLAAALTAILFPVKTNENDNTDNTSFLPPTGGVL